MTADDLRSILKQWKLPVWDEKVMQASLAQVLQEQGLAFEREKKLDNGQIDFLVGKIGVECKIAGTWVEVLRQLAKYAAADCIEEILVVTTKPTHFQKIDGRTLQGKPIRVYWITPF